MKSILVWSVGQKGAYQSFVAGSSCEVTPGYISLISIIVYSKHCVCCRHQDLTEEDNKINYNYCLTVVCPCAPVEL